MNAPCPLAVMAETIAAHESEVACHGLIYTDADRLREARAAVAELVEAAKALDARMPQGAEALALFHARPEVVALRAALTKFGGAA